MPHSLPPDDTPGRQHAGADSRRDFVLSLGLLLHVFLVVAELAAGWWGHSAALLADAGRNLGSGLCLGLAWWGVLPTQRPGRYPYGFNRLPFQVCLYTALGMCVLLGILLLATLDHLRHPQPADGLLVMLLAGVGLLLHAGTAGLLLRGLPARANQRSGYRYLFTDALVSFALALGGALVYFTNWPWTDPCLAVGLLGVLAYAGWGLLAPSQLLRANAWDIDAEQVRAFLQEQPGVRGVRKLRVWALNPVDTALSVHLVRSRGDDGAFIEYLQEALQKEFNIGRATVYLDHETWDTGVTGAGY